MLIRICSFAHSSQHYVKLHHLNTLTPWGATDGRWLNPFKQGWVYQIKVCYQATYDTETHSKTVVRKGSNILGHAGKPEVVERWEC